jgi:hypothetical protein
MTSGRGPAMNSLIPPSTSFDPLQLAAILHHLATLMYTVQSSNHLPRDVTTLLMSTPSNAMRFALPQVIPSAPYNAPLVAHSTQNQALSNLRKRRSIHIKCNGVYCAAKTFLILPNGKWSAHCIAAYHFSPGSTRLAWLPRWLLPSLACCDGSFYESPPAEGAAPAAGVPAPSPRPRPPRPRNSPRPPLLPLPPRAPPRPPRPDSESLPVVAPPADW